MPVIKRIQTLQYLGSKSRLLENICLPIIDNGKTRRVVDLFAGTGSVGYALSPYKEIISNDIELYSYILNDAILNGCRMSKDEIGALLNVVNIRYGVIEKYLSNELSVESEMLSSPLESYGAYADFSTSTPSVFCTDSKNKVFCNLTRLVKMVVPGKKEQDVPFPCLFTTYFSNAYFGIRQCCQIDAIASTIHDLTDERQRNVLLAALMSAMSIVSSSTTHFAQFLTVKNKSTFKNIKEKRLASIFETFKEIIARFAKEGLFDCLEKKHDVYNLDYETCLNTINIDSQTLVYADPPYFKEHYSRYYHVLNTLCLYDYPGLAVNPQSKELSIGRYRIDRKSSDFGKRAKALSAFACLINICAEKKADLLISYSENSLVKISELLQLAKERYIVRVERISLQHSSQGRATESSQKVKEFLFYCTTPDSRDIEIEKTADAIKEIKPVVDNPGGFIHNYMARKPYNIVSAIINGFTKQGDHVYDPMFGSGTTLIEASKLGRYAIGTDINPIAGEICSVSLRRWDLSRINSLIDRFVTAVENACSDLYTLNIDGEERIIERFHFDVNEGCLIPTNYWYKTSVNGKLSGRKKDNATNKTIVEYGELKKIAINRLHNHALIPNSRIAVKEGATVFGYFCNRNLVALDRIFAILDEYQAEYGYEVLKILVSSAVNLIKLSDKKASSQMPYWLPKKNATSRNAVFVIKKKAVAIKEGLQYLQENCKSFIDDGCVSIYSNPAQKMSADLLNDESIDLVLTDPPYTDQVPYLEYNQLWLYLFDMGNMINLEDELVVSDSPMRSKGEDDFDQVFRGIVKRTARSLKDGGIFALFYHTFDLKSWSNILTIMQENGLRYVYQIPTPAPRKSFKTVMSPNSTLDGNYLLFFVKDGSFITKEFKGELADAVEMVKARAESIIQSREHTTTQDLYDQGILKEAFEKGYLFLLSENYKTFADVLKNSYKHNNGYWEVQE